MMNDIVNVIIIFWEIYFSFNMIFVGVVINFIGGMNIFGLVVFLIVFGIILGKMGGKVKLFKVFFFVFNDVVMILVILIMW